MDCASFDRSNVRGFAQKVVFAATPPDVRRRLCLAVSVLRFGLRPSSAFGLKTLGHSPNQGHSPSHTCEIGGAQPPPHIRRRSRSSKTKNFVFKATSDRRRLCR